VSAISRAASLLPRDRVRALIDPVSPFLEVGQLAAHGLYGGEGAIGRPHRRGSGMSPGANA